MTVAALQEKPRPAPATARQDLAISTQPARASFRLSKQSARPNPRLRRRAPQPRNTIEDVKGAVRALQGKRRSLELADATFRELLAHRKRIEAQIEPLKQRLADARTMAEKRAAAVLAAAPETLALFTRYRAAQAEVARLAQTLRLFPAAGSRKKPRIGKRFRSPPALSRIKPGRRLYPPCLPMRKQSFQEAPKND